MNRKQAKRLRRELREREGHVPRPQAGELNMTMIVIGAPPRSLVEQIAELETTLVYVQATVFQEEAKGNYSLAAYWRKQAEKLEREIEKKKGH